MDKLKVKSPRALKGESSLSSPKSKPPAQALREQPTSENEQLAFAFLANALNEMVKKYEDLRGEAILAMLGQSAGICIQQGAPAELHDQMTQLVLNNILAVLSGQVKKTN